jgi:hypothetical protein
MAGKNPYPGVNAHLNSALQPSGWHGFHNKYLTHLSDAIDNSLPNGYYTANEESLQLAHINLLDEFTPPLTERIRPDILIRKSSDMIPSETPLSTATVTNPSMTIDFDYLLSPEDDVRALVIYKFKDSVSNSIPVTRIELLSPANKPPSSYYAMYLKKRVASLWAELNLVEIDFLHQTQPILPYIPKYPTMPDSTPYYAIVNDPHIRETNGKVEIYQIGVLDPLPKFYVPLEGDDKFILDLGQAYQQVYDNSRLFQQLGNPASELKNPEAYSPDDRAKLADFIKKMTESS